MSSISASDFRKYLDIIVGQHSDGFSDVDGQVTNYQTNTQTYHTAIIEIELDEQVRVCDSRQLEQYGCDGIKFELYTDDQLHLTIDSNEGKLGFWFYFI